MLKGIRLAGFGFDRRDCIFVGCALESNGSRTRRNRERRWWRRGQTTLALVLLQRVFDQPLVGLVALAIVVTSVLAGVPITRWRIPPFIVAWIIPLAAGIAVGYVHPVWQGVSVTIPLAVTPAPLQAMVLALPYMSVIAPMAFYHVLQDIASAAGKENPS